jgi:hypothetical protein
LLREHLTGASGPLPWDELGVPFDNELATSAVAPAALADLANPRRPGGLLDGDNGEDDSDDDKEVCENHDSDEMSENDNSGEFSEDNYSGQLSDNDDSGEFSEDDDSGEFSEDDDSGELSENDDSGELSENNDSVVMSKGHEEDEALALRTKRGRRSCGGKNGDACDDGSDGESGDEVLVPAAKRPRREVSSIYARG